MPEKQFISTEQLIGRALDAGVELGANPHQTIETYIQQGLVPPRLINGMHAPNAVDRLVAIDKLFKEGKSTQEILEIIRAERRSFLSKISGLNSLVNTYSSSSKGLLMLASLATLIVFSFTLITKTPASFAKVAIENGGFVAKQAAKPAGIALANVIKAAKSDDENATDPLGLTNIDKVITINERQEIVIEKTIVSSSSQDSTTNASAGEFLSLNEFGNLEIEGEIVAGAFVGDGSRLTNLSLSALPLTLLSSDQIYANPGWLSSLSWGKISAKPTLLSSLDGISDDLGDIDLVAGAGVTITPNDTNNTITFTLAGSGVNADLVDSLDSTQFLRSDTSDSFTSGTLTLSVGTDLNVLGTFTCANCVGDAAIPNTITASNYLPLGGGVLTGGLTVTGVTGLVDGDVPNTITASNYLLLAGGTLAGNVNFNNNLALNLGNAGTDFTTGGGLNIATDLDTNGHFALGSGASVSSSIVVNLVDTGNLTTGILTGFTSSNNGLSITGIQVSPTITGSNPTNFNGIVVQLNTNTPGGWADNGAGIYIKNPTFTAGGIWYNYGLRIAAISGGTFWNREIVPNLFRF